ncbi:MAG: hypothetical protein S4CHLAM2_07910 [Chlamydiales bacterium]|nr:hypothetical protein [Chlamydiales bacterium]
MAVNAYAERLLNSHEVGPRTSVSREEVMLSFKFKNHEGMTCELMNSAYTMPLTNTCRMSLTDGCPGDQKLYEYEVVNYIIAPAAFATLVITALGFYIAAASLGITALTTHNLSHFNTIIGLTVATCITAGLCVLPVALLDCSAQRKKKYLNERLEQKKLEAYLTEVKARADYIGQSDRVCQGKARYAREISRQLSAGELKELAE